MANDPVNKDGAERNFFSDLNILLHSENVSLRAGGGISDHLWPSLFGQVVIGG